jgi:hypothetical protein
MKSLDTNAVWTVTRCVEHSLIIGCRLSHHPQTAPEFLPHLDCGESKQSSSY